MESHELDFKYNLKSLLKRITGCVPVFLCTYYKCLESERMNTLFPENEQTSMKTRNQERFKVNFANRERYKNSAIPYLQRMLNSCESEKNKIIRNVGF